MPQRKLKLQAHLYLGEDVPRFFQCGPEAAASLWAGPAWAPRAWGRPASLTCVPTTPSCWQSGLEQVWGRAGLSTSHQWAGLKEVSFWNRWFLVADLFYWPVSKRQVWADAAICALRARSPLTAGVSQAAMSLSLAGRAGLAAPRATRAPVELDGWSFILHIQYNFLNSHQSNLGRSTSWEVKK